MPGVDGIRALRAALKFLLRRFGLKAVKIGEVRNQCRYWGQSGHALLHCICPLMTQSGHATGRLCAFIARRPVVKC
jgi:hypothetical protein